MKIVLIGAGSRVFGLGQIADVMRCTEFQGKNVTLSLVDEDPAALELMTRAAERIKQFRGADVKLESHTDRCKALPGADYVVVAVSRKRYELWEQDFRVPMAHGIRHAYGENGGPGAVFHALRSFELIIPICRDVERLCPNALVMNFTNPEARVLHAIRHLTKVNAAGFCHGVFDANARIMAYLNKSYDDLRIISAGLNHLYCILSVKDKKSGKEYLPELVKMAAEDPDPKVPLFRTFAKVFDIFTFPSDDHIGEYLTWGTDYHGIAWKHGRETKRVKLSDAKPDTLKDYADGKLPADSDWAVTGTAELTVPIICDIAFNRGSFRDAVNVLNDEGYIENLPRDIVVEVPATVDAKGIHPVKVGPVPERFAAFLRPQCVIHGLVTEAYRTKSRKLLLQALLVDPIVSSSIAAEKLLDDMLRLQAQYLPEFH